MIKTALGGSWDLVGDVRSARFHFAEAGYAFSPLARVPLESWNLPNCAAVALLALHLAAAAGDGRTLFQ